MRMSLAPGLLLLIIFRLQLVHNYCGKLGRNVSFLPMNLAAYGGDPTGNLLCVNFNQDCRQMRQKDVFGFDFLFCIHVLKEKFFSSSLAVGSKSGYKLFSLNSVEKLEEIYEYGKCCVILVRLQERKKSTGLIFKGTYISHSSMSSSYLSSKLKVFSVFLIAIVKPLSFALP